MHFFVNPGEPKFTRELAAKYLQLSKNRFEIGSHGYTHHHYLNLPFDNFIIQQRLSRQKIYDLTGVNPVSFAFPHHEFTSEMLNTAKEYYLETRNTLNNSVLFGLKNNTTLDDARKAMESAIQARKSLVFSGHSVQIHEDIVADGYEPIKIEMY